MTDTPDARGFMLDGGSFITALTVTYRPEAHAGRKVAILNNEGDTILLPVPMALTLLIDLTNALYDNGALDMPTAERLETLARSVLADREACGACGGSGQVGSPADPESCNTCRGTGRMQQPVMTREEYDAFLTDIIEGGR
jgi:hypothetical protein